MKIKKVDDKPMVIHTKEKPKLKIKGAPETKIKGRNVLTVRHGPKTVQTVTAGNVEPDGKIKLKKGIAHVADKRKSGQTKTAAESVGYMGRNNTVQDRRGNRTAQGRNADANAQGRRENRTVSDRSVYGNIRNQNQNGTIQGRRGKEQEVCQSVNRENRMYAQYRRSKAEKEAAIKKKPLVSATVVSVAAKTTLDEMDGGNEVYEAYMAADSLAKPATNAIDAGRNLYRSKAANAKEQKIRKKQARSRIREKAVKESAVKAARKTAQETGKKAAKETSKAAARTAAAAAGTGAGGVLAGTLAGEAVGIAMDKRDLKNSTRKIGRAHV